MGRLATGGSTALFAIAVVCAGCTAFDSNPAGDASTTDGGGDGASGDAAPGGAALSLDLTDCGDLPTEVAFSRATPATYFDAAGVLRQAAAGEPRCAFDPTTGDSLGVLFEPPSTNVFDRSRGAGLGVDGLPSGWLSQHNANVVAAGSSTASTVFTGFNQVEIAVTNNAAALEFYQIAAGADAQPSTTYTASIYMRSVGGTGGFAGCSMFAQSFTANFAQFLEEAPRQARPVPGAGFERRSFTFTTPVNTGAVRAFFVCNVAANSSYTITVAAPQIEPGSQPWSPILTDGAPATRDVDQLAVSDASFAAAGDATVFVELTSAAASSTQTAIQIADASADVWHTLSRDADQWTVEMLTGGTSSTLRADVGAAPSTRIAYALTAASSEISIDGTTSTGGGLQHPAGTTAVSIGTDITGNATLAGSVARILYYQRALDSAELSALTAP